MPIDPEALYVQLGQLVETMPNLKTSGPTHALTFCTGLIERETATLDSDWDRSDRHCRHASGDIARPPEFILQLRH
jgi:hypothetical protein